ncbi:MAG: hypothetical protein FWG57_00165 [Endomicrobia bacterium]|nr:hypothetical protein [Endomicrobiia bacterium]
MKKIFLLLAVCFTALFFVASCSKNNNKKTGDPANVPTIMIRDWQFSEVGDLNQEYGVDTIELWPNRKARLTAFIKDKDGAIIAPDYSDIEWTSIPPGYCTNLYSGVCEVQVGAVVPSELKIKADYKQGTAVKEISVTYDPDPITVTFEIELGFYSKIGGTYYYGSTVSGGIKAVVRRLDDGSEVENVLVEWSSSPGIFFSNSVGSNYETSSSLSGKLAQLSGELFTEPEGYVTIVAKIRGNSYYGGSGGNLTNPDGTNFPFAVHFTGSGSPSPAPSKKGSLKKLLK